MKLTSTVRRAGRGDPDTLFSLVGILALLLLLAVPTVAYTSTHNRYAPAVALAVVAVIAVGIWRRTARRARRREEIQAAAAQARAEADWARFVATFPATARGAVVRLCDPTERASAFAEVGLASPEIVSTRNDWGIWPTERGAAVRVIGVDPDACARASVVLADALGVPSLKVRPTRRRDGAYELHLITR
ncbi:hypothetical protein [Nocardia brasiliensis]|uniref:hypothetical protein n=1 Tax=Nocardia brasiliensis TaxID=37326 RepID=UPI002458C081|nr:hypothetical protein [Nocardia brasiliensis]